MEAVLKFTNLLQGVRYFGTHNYNQPYGLHYEIHKVKVKNTNPQTRLHTLATLLIPTLVVNQ